MSRLFLAFFALLTAAGLQAQTVDYQPMHYSGALVAKKKEIYIKQLHPQYITADKKYIGEWNGYLYDVYRTYTKASGEHQFISEPYVTAYLQRVLEPILAANQIQDKIELVCTRYQEVNAYNMGDNRLYVNIGVLKLLENEAQLAFLLSHELSHYLLQHSQAKFQSMRTVSRDKHVKTEMKDIRAAKYNKLDRAVQFAAKYRYTFANYSRAQERAADSMAMVLLRPTQYSIAEGIGLMRVLEKSDSDRAGVSYVRHFSSGDKPLRPELLENSRNAISFGNKRAVELEADSLKSHPDLPLRMAFIETALKSENAGGGAELYIAGRTTFDSIKAAARYEIIESYGANKRYAAGLYHALSQLEARPGDAYLVRKAAFSMRDVVRAVKTHTIQDHVPVESETHPLAYNQLLRIIDRTSLPELTQLYQNFVANYPEQLAAYPELKQAQ